MTALAYILEETTTSIADRDRPGITRTEFTVRGFGGIRVKEVGDKGGVSIREYLFRGDSYGSIDEAVMAWRLYHQRTNLHLAVGAAIHQIWGGGDPHGWETLSPEQRDAFIEGGQALVAELERLGYAIARTS